MKDRSAPSKSTFSSRGFARVRTVARSIGPEALLGLVFLLSAWVATHATRTPEGLALLWPSNAIAGAVLIRMARVRWALALPILLLASFAANMLGGGDHAGVASALALVNVLEVGAAALIFRRLLRYPFPDISIMQASSMTLVMGVLVTGFGALLTSTLLHAMTHAPWWINLRDAWAADALGMCALAPCIVLFSRENLARLARPAFIRRNLAALPLCLLVTALAIRYVSFPFVVVALTPMMAAFQVGAFGTSILVALNTATVVLLWALDIRPMGTLAGGSTLDGMPFAALIATTIPPLAVGLATDARRRVARVLRASERRYRDSMEYSPLGVILLDRTGQWTFTNTAMQEMLGFTRAELQRLTIESLAHPDEVADVWQRWNQLLEGRVESYKITRRFRRRDGSWLWVHCAVSLAHDDSGAPTHFVAQVESLEERRLAEAQLANEREFLRTTLDSIGDAVITADAAGRITYMNDSAVALTGKPLAFARQRFLHEVLRLKQSDLALSAPDIIERCRREKGFVKREEPCSLERPDGSICHVSDTATPVLDANRELSGFVVVLHDVTVSLQRTRELHHRADHDALTGLLNRSAFERGVHFAFSAAQRNASATGSALVVVDLDRFKAVNDSAGHAAGDAVLRHVAAVMRRSVRPADAVGRLGGDEFAVLLNDCDAARACEVGQRLRDALNPLVTNWEGVSHATGASLGLAHWEPGFTDPGHWLKSADEACYESKRCGRGRLEAWSGGHVPLAVAGGRLQ
jgi:diguanylate cyclase (GGDEF)-like protein/PAS domain S-box-containing protein